MEFIFRCILDDKKDIIRDIRISSQKNLEAFHFKIRDAFGMPEGEMASFYKSDSEWNQGDEIPLIDMSDAGNATEMKDYKISDIFSQVDDKILFVYDFLEMWTFFIFVTEILPEGETEGTHTLLNIGKMPTSSSQQVAIDIDESMLDEMGESSDSDEESDDFYDNLGDDFGYEDDFNDSY